MPDINKYKINYAPESYWDDPVRMLLANIKGEHRRRRALKLIREGRLDTLEQWSIAEKLSDEVRELAGRIHPMFMGGEYLPDCEEREVEIARVSLESTMADVISIRAKREKESIEYQLVDEYESVFEFAPKSSKEPLTLGELISLIDSAENECWKGPKGLTNTFRDSNLAPYSDEASQQAARRLVDFVTVTSIFYSELQRWYREEAQEWLQEHTRSRNRPADIYVAASEKLFAAPEPEAGVADRASSLTLIQADLGECTRCALARLGRKTIVFGEGNPNAELMFVGEGPGTDEDEQGRPFVSRAGQLLNNMIGAMGLKREQVYIANIVKCCPPENRTPEKEECETCSPFLFRQIDVIQPKAIVALGAVAARTLTGLTEPFAELCGRFYDFRGARLAVTYHPAYLLRNPSQKKEAWKDLQAVMEHLKLTWPA